MSINISNILEKISVKFNIKFPELVKYVNSLNDVSTKSTENVEEEKEGENFDSYSAAVLKEKCRVQGLKVSGTKTELISRLKNPTDPSSVARPKKTDSKTSSSNHSEEVNSKLTSKLISSLTSSKKLVSKNKYGNLEDPLTHLIFDKKTGKVIGVQSQTSSEIIQLDEESMELCDQYRYPYDVPKNIDKNTNLDNTQIEELEEDSDVEPEVVISDDDEDEDDVNSD